MYMKVNMIIAVEWTGVEEKNLKSFRVGENWTVPFAITGRNALSIKLIKQIGNQAIVSSLYTRWW